MKFSNSTNVTSAPITAPTVGSTSTSPGKRSTRSPPNSASPQHPLTRCANPPRDLCYKKRAPVLGRAIVGKEIEVSYNPQKTVVAVAWYGGSECRDERVTMRAEFSGCGPWRLFTLGSGVPSSVTSNTYAAFSFQPVILTRRYLTDVIHNYLKSDRWSIGDF